MIRINLGKTRIQDLDGLESAYASQPDSSGRPAVVQILIKAALLVFGVVALYFYETTNLETLSLRAQQVIQERSRLQANLDEKNERLSSLGGVQEDSKVLNDKMKLLKELSQLRLREVKSLDYLQTITPPHLWLVSLGINKDRYLFKGRAKSEAAVSLFVGKLEDGGYFSDVVLIKDSEKTENKDVLREFEVVARSEVVN